MTKYMPYAAIAALVLVVGYLISRPKPPLPPSLQSKVDSLERVIAVANERQRVDSVRIDSLNIRMAGRQHVIDSLAMETAGLHGQLKNLRGRLTNVSPDVLLHDLNDILGDVRKLPLSTSSTRPSR